MPRGSEGGDADRPLVERAQTELPYGAPAYDELVRKYSAVVFGRAYGIPRCSADADEVTQGVFLAGHYLRQSLPAGSPIVVAGERGTVEQIGSIDATFRDGDRRGAYPTRDCSMR